MYLKIKINHRWMIQHRDNDKAPIDMIICFIEKKKSVTPYLRNMSELRYDDKVVEWSESFVEILQEFLKLKYGDDVDNYIDICLYEGDLTALDSVKECVVEPEEILTEEDLDEIENMFENGEFEDLLQKIKSDTDKLEDKDADNIDLKVQSVLKDVSELVGAKEFKALALEVANMAEQIKKNNTFSWFANQCYLFSVADGYGYTTCLNLLSRLLESVDICKLNNHRFNEIKVESKKASGLSGYLRMADNDYVSLISYDISECMDNTDSVEFKSFLRSVAKFADKNIVVFRVPFVEKDVLAKLEFSLNDLLSVRTVTIPPFGENELKVIAQKEFEKYGFNVAKPAWKKFFERITEEKSDGKFYGLNTIFKVVKEIIYDKQLSNVNKKSDNKLIVSRDIKLWNKNIPTGSTSGLEQLSKLVGGENIKKRVEEIIAQIELSKKLDIGERPCIHMRFVGNPGTGKTTVARIIGRVLKEKGVLRVGNFYEYKGRDFCGEHIGETAPKTASMFRDAYGSVLFIDEAYSLYYGDKGSRDYGREALDTMIAQMENHRDDFVVIMAGYTDDMEILMKGNAGLASRMPYTIEFPNFTKEQLYEIFVSMVKSKFKYEESLFEEAHKYFSNLSDEFVQAKEFSNARFVRNLFERTWAKASMRCQLSGKKDIVLLKDDFDLASKDNEFKINTPKKMRLGF